MIILQSIIKEIILLQQFSVNDRKNPTIQTGFLPKFSADKTQNLSNPNNSSNPSNPDSTSNNPNTYIYIAIESLSSDREEPTTQISFLFRFFTNKAQNLDNLDIRKSQYINIESLSNTRERSTKKNKVLANFSAKKV